jgi:hypothetical protein
LQSLKKGIAFQNRLVQVIFKKIETYKVAIFSFLPTANSQQPTANSQQPTANSQQPTHLLPSNS